MPAEGDLWTTVDEVSYDDALPWPTEADGEGPSLQLIDPLMGNDWIGNWAVDDTILYTPGAVNSVDQVLDGIPELRINEILPGNASTLADNAGDYDPWVELLVLDVSPTGLDDLYLTDDYTDLTKWAFPAGLATEKGDYLTVWVDGEPGEQTSNDHLHTSFAMDGLPGSLALVWDLAGTPIVLDYADYDYTPDDQSSGRWPNGQGELYPMESSTPEAANSGPHIGPVVISEIHYNPFEPDNDLEFIELYNRSSSTVNLWETYDSTDYPWQIEGFQFPVGTTLGAGENLLVVPFDPLAEPAKLDAFKTY